MNHYIICCFFLAFSFASGLQLNENEVYFSPNIRNSDDLISSVSECFGANDDMCMKYRVLAFLDKKAGIQFESGRAFEDGNIDKVIFDRVGRVLQSQEFRFRLPEFLFQSAEISYKLDRGLDIDFPERSDENEARGILKKKLLLPVLLLLKLKFKALLPVFVALASFKAVKALILSKIALAVVIGYIVYNIVKSKGMEMPMMPPTEHPAPVYGPPASQYGAPASTPAAPADSYNPQWDPNSSGPYARVWEPQQLAYSSYYPSNSGQSSSSSIVPSSGYSNVISASAQTTE